MNLGKTLVAAYALLFLAVTLFSGVFFVRMHRQYQNLLAQEVETRSRLTDAERRLEEQERYLRLLNHDPVFIEQVIRRRLGYARSDELLFRFQD